MPTKTRQRWAMPTLRIFQKSNISPISEVGDLDVIFNPNFQQF